MSTEDLRPSPKTEKSEGNSSRRCSPESRPGEPKTTRGLGEPQYVCLWMSCISFTTLPVPRAQCCRGAQRLPRHPQDSRRQHDLQITEICVTITASCCHHHRHHRQPHEFCFILFSFLRTGCTSLLICHFLSVNLSALISRTTVAWTSIPGPMTTHSGYIVLQIFVFWFFFGGVVKLLSLKPGGWGVRGCSALYDGISEV